VEGRDHLKDIVVSVNSNKIGIKEVGRVCVNWIYLAYDRDQWWVIVNMVMNSHSP
jgi:hypothetical protein